MNLLSAFQPFSSFSFTPFLISTHFYFSHHKYYKLGKRIRNGDGSWVAVDGTEEREFQALGKSIPDELAEATKWFEWSQEVQRSSLAVKALETPLSLSFPPKSLAFAPNKEEISPVLKAGFTKPLVRSVTWGDMAKLKMMEEG